MSVPFFPVHMRIYVGLGYSDEERDINVASCRMCKKDEKEQLWPVSPRVGEVKNSNTPVPLLILGCRSLLFYRCFYAVLRKSAESENIPSESRKCKKVKKRQKPA